MKLIYKPKGAAGEYAKYAVNFFNGCSNKCAYCYLKRGSGAWLLGGNKPALKAGYSSEDDEITAFCSDLRNNLSELREHGIFMSFTTDPMIKETFRVTLEATLVSLSYGVPVTILTKCTDYYDILVERARGILNIPSCGKIIIGTTLTGCDELEPKASPHSKRVEMLRKANNDGLKTIVSLEPVIDLKRSYCIVEEVLDCVDEIWIGLKSPVKADAYPMNLLSSFISKVNDLAGKNNIKILWKESVLKLADKYGIPEFLY